MRRRRLAWLVAATALATAPTAGAQAQRSLIERGKELFGRYCVACHGVGGTGHGSAGEQIGAGPGRGQSEQRAVAPSLRGVGALAADFYVRTGYMPLERIGLQPRRSRVLFDESEIRALVAYVASLGPGPPVPRPRPLRGRVSRGQHLFAAHCAGCHQIAAEGGYVSGALAPPLEDATPTQVAEAVRIGPYVMPRFSTKEISDADLNSIVAYVAYAKHPDDRGGWAIGHLGPVPEGLVTWFLAAAAIIAVCVVLGKRLKREAG